MNNNEATCNSCLHSKVCSLKGDYLDISKKAEAITPVDSDIYISVGCNHYTREHTTFYRDTGVKCV